MNVHSTFFSHTPGGEQRQCPHCFYCFCCDPALGAQVMNHSACQHLTVCHHLPFYRYLFPALGRKYIYILKKNSAWASIFQCMSILPVPHGKNNNFFLFTPSKDSLLNGREVFLLRMWTKGQQQWGLLSNPLPAPK